MDFLKDMDSICGRIYQIIKEISSKDIEMVMEFGKMFQELKNYTKAITCQTRNTDMEFMIGEMDTFTKDTELKQHLKTCLTPECSAHI